MYQIKVENILFDDFIEFLNKNNWSEREEEGNTELQSIINTHSLGMTVQRDTNVFVYTI